MSRARVLIAEIDGSDESIRGAVTAFLTRFEPAAVEPTPATLAPAEPVAALLDTAPVSRAPKPKPVKVKRAKTSPPPKGDAGVKLSPCGEKLLAILARGPKSSMDLVRESGFTDGTVYPQLAKMRAAKLIETKRVDDEPYPLNFLVANK